MKTEESSSVLSSTEDFSPSSIIRSVKKEEKEKELEGDDDNKDNDDKENHQWIDFFENITNNINPDDEDEGNDDDNDDNDDDRNEGVTAGRLLSSVTIKTEEEKFPYSIPSKSSMIKMEEEVGEEVFTFIINNTLVWGDGTITGGVTACEVQQHVKKEEKKKEEEEAVAKKEDDNGNDTGYESWAEGVSHNTNDAFLTAASTNYCVRRKFKSNNIQDYDDGDDERKPPPKKKIRVLAAVEEDITCEADVDHTENDDDDDDGNDVGDGISSKIITTKTKYFELWNRMFRRLVAYKQQHQNTNVPNRYKEDPQLGRWVMTQQTSHKKEIISKHRADLLNSIGFVWRNNLDEQWMEVYQRLITYKKQHKSTSVPKVYKEDQKLGAWVFTQRHCYKNKELSLERINYLESIGFVWKVRDRVPWIDMYDRLVAYKVQYGTTLVQLIHNEDSSLIHNEYSTLGNWVHNQRNRCKKKDRVQLLKDIGFVWETPRKRKK